jgi:type II secretory pathway pseudopilin PulG
MNGTIGGNRRTAGFSLLEAMVAMLVLAFGMLVIARFQLTLSANSDIARQRSEATRLAQHQIDRLRSFVQREADGTPGGPSLSYLEDVVTPDPATYDVAGATTNTTFGVTTTVSPSAGDRFRWLRVVVAWDDRTGAAHNVTLNTIISDGDPDDVGKIALGRSRSTILRPKNRHINVPYPAVTLRGGTSSAFMPPPGNVVFVFDNMTGDVLRRCTGVPTLTEGMDLEAVTGAQCTAYLSPAYLLAGYVWFKTEADPTAANIDEPHELIEPTYPLLPTVPSSTAPLSIDATATGIGPSGQECFAQRQLTARNNSTGAELTIADGDSIPSGYSGTDVPRFIAYTCVVSPVEDTLGTGTRMAWWGALTLNPSGWAIGTIDGQYKVCRFTGDYNGDGVLSNHEHPRYYRRVTGSLDNQNFLVIDAEDNCPTDVAAAPLGGDYVNTNTAAHQPRSVSEPSFKCLSAACTSTNKVVMEPGDTTPIPMD